MFAKYAKLRNTNCIFLICRIVTHTYMYMRAYTHVEKEEIKLYKCLFYMVCYNLL